MLRPQDVLVLLQLAVGLQSQAEWTQQQIAHALSLSQAEVNNALKRAAASGLYHPQSKKVVRHALLELLLHGLKYFFPAKLGGPCRGVPTAWATLPLADVISPNGETPVWAHPDGSVRGHAVTPLYRTAPDVALANPKMHEILALIDAIRIGRARERQLAVSILTERLSA